MAKEKENELNVKGYFRKRDRNGRVVFTKEYDFTISSVANLQQVFDIVEEITKD